MESMHVWFPKIAIYFGILTVILLSCDDFRKNIRKFISRWRYYLAGSIFVSMHLFIYLVLTYAFVDQSPAQLIIGDIPLQGSFFNMLMPLLVAFVYAGAGAGNFRIAGRDIQWNQQLRNALENMFNAKPLEMSDVQYKEKETEQFYNQLRKEAERVELVAKERKWDHLLAKWQLFKEDEEMLKDQKEHLKNINDDLVQVSPEVREGSLAETKLSDAMNKIKGRIRCINQKLTKKVQELLVTFAFEYFQDEAELKKYLIGIEVLDRGIETDRHNPSVINRGLILGFMFGLLMGPLFGIVRDEDVIYFCWRGSIVLMLFTGCVSYGVHSKNWIKASIVGALGGYTAHFLWILMKRQNLDALLSGSAEIIADLHLYTDPIIGLSYGIVTALILLVLKYQIGSKIANNYILYVITTLTGAITYSLLNWLISSRPITVTTWIITAGIGAIAMSSMALAVNVPNFSTKIAPTRNASIEKQMIAEMATEGHH